MHWGGGGGGGFGGGGGHGNTPGAGGFGAGAARLNDGLPGASSGWGAAAPSTSTGGAGAGLGGGIFNHSGTVDVSRSTFYGNRTYGGNGHLPPTVAGGGIFMYGGQATISASTFAESNARNPRDRSLGGAIYAHGGQVSLRNTLIASLDSSFNSQLETDGGGIDINGAPNWAQGWGTGGGNRWTPSSGYPLSGGLADNGGPTPTVLSNGLVQGLGSSTFCTGAYATDQRGVARPSACDLGSVEHPRFTSGSSATFFQGEPATFTVRTGDRFAGTPTIPQTGTLLAGLTFKDNGDGTETLSGTPTQNTGSQPRTLTFRAGVATQTFTLTVLQRPTFVNTTDHHTWTVGKLDQNLFPVQGSGGGPITVTCSCAALQGTGLQFSLQAGLPAVWRIIGAPVAGSSGTYHVTVTARSSIGTTTLPFTATIAQPPAITSANSATFDAASSGSFEVTTTGYPDPVLTETGALPQGVTFTDNGDGTAGLSGTPEPGSGGSYPLTITAGNGASPNATQAFTLLVNESVDFTSADHADLASETPGSFTISTRGYPRAQIATTDSLPPGLSLVDNGNGTATLSGTPASGTDGRYDIHLTAGRDGATESAQTLSLTIGTIPAFTSGDAVTWSAGSGHSFTVGASGTPAPALSASGDLPAGVGFTDNGDG